MSIAGGLHNAFGEGVKVGCDCLQVFVKNQRQWRAPPLTDEVIRAWKRAARETRIKPVVAHASYLINLASPDAVARRRSTDAFVDELTRCEALGIRGLVVHPGAHMGEGEDAGLRRVADSLNAVHRKTGGYKVRTLLETTAGQGTSVGHRFEHLGAILDRLQDADRVDVCLDTCHLFAAGYDFRKLAGYEEVMDAFDRFVGARRVKCIHMNDSKRECGSRVDRHDQIGKGKLGRAGFKHIISDRRLATVPKILETPKGEDEKGRAFDALNLARLRRMVR